METLKRIDLSRVREAFELAGISPARNNDDRCILTAVLGQVPYIERLINYGFDHNYASGVTDGWDNRTIEERQKLDSEYEDYITDINSLVYKLGVADGREAATIMFSPEAKDG